MSLLVSIESSIKLIIEFLDKQLSSDRGANMKFKVVPPGGYTLVHEFVATFNLRLSSNSMSVKVSIILFNQFLATTASIVPEKVSDPSNLAFLTSLNTLPLIESKIEQKSLEVVLSMVLGLPELELEFKHTKNSCMLGMPQESWVEKTLVEA